MKSVLSPEEYSRTQIIVEDFGKPGGTGEILQEKLKKVSEVKDNWVIVINWLVVAFVLFCFLLLFFVVHFHCSPESPLHWRYLRCHICCKLTLCN